jgi:hypothetical protein
MKQDAEYYRCKSVHAAAERVLTQTFGGPIRLEEPQGVWVYPDECRITIQRAAVREGPPEAPATVIIKRIHGDDPYDPCDLRLAGCGFYDATTAWRLITEWTATRFLSRFAFDPPGPAPVGSTGSPPPAGAPPRCYGGDLAEGFVILEDLGSGDRLSDLLHGSDAARAEAALLGYATTLGRIHGATAGREPEYDRLWTELGQRTTTDRFIEAEALPRVWRRVCNVGDAFGVRWPDGVESDIEAVASAVRDPGPFLALTHGDNFPANDMFVNGCLRLYDFERAAFRHALYDGFVRPHLLPWRRYRLPDLLERRFEMLYRAELAKGCPEAADDARFARAGLEMRAAWVLRNTSWHLESALGRDSHWEGELTDQERRICPTVRQRTLLILDSFGEATEQVGHLQTLGTATRRLAACLRACWQPVPIQLQLFPAFAGMPEAQ